MHISFYAAAALVAGGLQASALPTSDRSSIDLKPVSLTGLGELDERAIDWWPATNCVRYPPSPRINPPSSANQPIQTTDLMHRNLPRRLRNPRLVVRRHQNAATEPGHDVLDVSFPKVRCLTVFTEADDFLRRCGLTCVSRNACFPAQQGVWNWQTLQQVTTNNEPAQMLAQMGMNGLVVP
jgi:hypothetical protein